MRVPHRKLLVSFLFSSILAALPFKAGAQERGIKVSNAPTGRYFALVIGNDDYISLPHLKTAAGDAREVEETLRTLYGFQTKLLLNGTRQQIISALNAYRQQLDGESSLLIYYAGHGHNDREEDKAYWLPVDASKEDSANWISADDITTKLKVIPSRHVLVVSDSCYSGTLTRGIEPIVTEAGARERFLQRMLSGRSRHLLASGGNEPVADGGGGDHSVFAGALLRGLRQSEREQFTAAELFQEFIEVSVAGRSDQTPEYSPIRNSGHESGAFVFMRVKAGAGSNGMSERPRRSARRRPSSTSFTAERAEELIKRRGFDELVRMTTKAIAANPSDALALRFRAQGMRNRSEVEQVSNDAREVLRLLPSPTSAREFEARCFAYYRLNDSDRAASECNEALRLDPSFVLAHISRALVYGMRKDGKDGDGVIKEYTEVIRLDPTYIAAYVYRGDAYIRFKGGADQAISDYTQAIRLDPTSTSPYIGRASAYRKKGDSERALGDYAEAIRLDPKESMFYYMRGEVYADKRDYTQAINDFSLSIRINPKNYGVYVARGNVYFNIKDFKGAVSDYTEAIRLIPNSAWAYDARAKAYEMMGDSARAIPDRQMAEKLRRK